MDISAILRARETGAYYIGDIERDITDVLRNIDFINQQVENVNTVQKEIFAQFPEEDFLCDAIDLLTDCVTEKMSKADIIEKIKKVVSMLDDIQTRQTHSTEYAKSLEIY